MFANGALALMTVMTSDERFVEWAWRIPFLASVILVFVGLDIRIGVLETPIFARLQARGAVATTPLVDVVRKNWRETTYSITYQLASITAGGPAPLIAVLLYRQFGTSTAIAVYMSICSLISLVCVFALRDRTGTLDHQ